MYQKYCIISNTAGHALSESYSSLMADRPLMAFTQRDKRNFYMYKDYVKAQKASLIESAASDKKEKKNPCELWSIQALFNKLWILLLKPNLFNEFNRFSCADLENSNFPHPINNFWIRIHFHMIHNEKCKLNKTFSLFKLFCTHNIIARN